MLSIGAMGGGQGVYYVGLAREDYYQAGGEPPGVWHGKAARDLGLNGVVDGDALARLFEGFHPTEERTLIQNAGEKDHQPGWDLTFSAPKSVSTLWSQADEATRKVIQDAHFAAVKEALSYIEDAAAITRRGKGGHIKEDARLIIATFEHGTSRAQDPQLHTHCLIMNACLREDGTSGTIESKPLYQAKMTAGALYRAELAAQLEQRLGLLAERKGSCFEIEGVSEGLMREFSKRRAEIEKVLHEKGYDSAVAAAAATLSTRQVKGHVSRAELFQEWQGTGREMGWGPDSAQKLLREAHTPERHFYQEWDGALFAAQERATEQQAYFSERDFIRYVAEECQGRGLGAREVREAGERHLQKSAEIVRLGDYRGESVYTTREMMALEKSLLDRVEASKDRYSVGVERERLLDVIASQKQLNEEQAGAVWRIAREGEGGIRVVSGMAGTGKTTMLKAARLAWESEGFAVHGAALSGKAAKGLADGADIPSDTLHKTLYELEKGRLVLNARSVLVVDEAGMVGTRMMERLVAATESAGARLVLVGDAKQLQPIEAGGPFSEMQRRLGAATLTNIQRQREGWAKEAVYDFAAGRADKGLQAYAVRGLLTVSEDRQEAYRDLIAAWRVEGVRAPEEQLIFAGTRLDAAALNRMAQEERLKAGVLGDESVSAPEGGGSFHVGDRVLFTKRSRMFEVENGSLGNVVDVDTQYGRIGVRLDEGNRVSIPLEYFPSVRLGYAMTTHKGQGATVERAFVLAGGSMQDRGDHLRSDVAGARRDAYLCRPRGGGGGFVPPDAPDEPVPTESHGAYNHARQGQVTRRLTG